MANPDVYQVGMECAPPGEPQLHVVTSEEPREQDHATPAKLAAGVSFANSPDDLPVEWQDRLRWANKHCRLPSETPEPATTTLVHGRVFVDNELLEYTGEFPHEPISSTINIVFGGFGGFKRTSRGLRHELARRGEASVTFEQIRADKRSNAERLLRPQKAHVDVVEAVAYDIASNTSNQNRVPEKQTYGGFMRFAAIPHSMSGLPAMRFAARHPDKVEGVVEVQAVGKRSPSLDQLLFSIPTGLAAAAQHEFIPYISGDAIDRTPRNAWRAIRYYGQNPIRTLGEMASCVFESNLEQTEKVRASGRYVAYLAGQYDILVPRTAHIAELVDLYQVMPLGHLGPQHRAGKVADYIVAAQQQFRLAV